MQLENIQAVLRPRLPSEAADLGLALTRRHWRAVMRGWLCLMLPLWGILAVLLRDYPGWFTFVIWWLKPLYGRVPVLYLGRTLFSAPPTLKEQIRAWPRLLTRDLGRTLLWGRASSTRALTLPVTVLEGLSRKMLRKRMAILKSWSSGPAGTLLIAASLIELAVACGVTMLIFKLIPAESMQAFTESLRSFPKIVIPPWMIWGSAACWLVAVTLVEPFFAGAGFGLYLNTRTEMEGWDIELVFRRLGERLSATPAADESFPKLTKAASPILLLCLLLNASSGNVQAAPRPPAEPVPVSQSTEEEDVPEPPEVVEPEAPEMDSPEMEEAENPGDTLNDAAESQRVRAQIREVLANPDFTEHTEKTKKWVADPKPQEKEFKRVDWLPVDLINLLLRLLFYVLLAGGLGWLIYHFWKQRGLFRRGARGTGNAKIAPPRTVMGLDVAPETLPDDISASAWIAWQNGERERAVRLLYRGALAWLVLRGGLTIQESDTEGDCLRRARALPDAAARAYFEKLTNAWTGAAYAHAWPRDQEMETLCREWPFSLQNAAEKRKPADLQALRRTVSLLLTGMILSGFLTSCNGHWEEKIQETGYKGQARKNPWLAAERFLETEGFSVQNHGSLATLPERNGVLCVTEETVASDGAVIRLLAWVNRGGHLIYFASGGESYRNDWLDKDEAETLGDQPLLKALGIAPAHREDKLSPPAVGEITLLSGIELRSDFALEPRLDTSAMPQWGLNRKRLLLAGPLDQAALVSLLQGRGRVTVLANAKLFRSRWIDERDHARLLKELVMTGREDNGYFPEVWFIAGGRISLWEMLSRYAWRPLLALGILLALWLWRCMPRPGPAREPVPRAHLRFSRHLEEAGAFLWRQRLTAPLLDPARRAVLQAAQARGLPEPGAAQNAELAARSSLTVERVEAALRDTAEAVPDPRLFVRKMSDLQVLSKII